MKIGNLDGKFKIYNWKGELMLKENESILCQCEVETNFLLSTSWRAFWTYPIFYANKGNGRIYITNNRIVYIREPDFNKAANDITNLYSMVGYGNANYNASQDAFNIVRKQGREYCDIRWRDCAYYRYYKGIIRLYLRKISKRKRLSILSGEGYLFTIPRRNFIVKGQLQLTPELIKSFADNGITLSKRVKLKNVLSNRWVIIDQEKVYSISLSNEELDVNVKTYKRIIKKYRLYFSERTKKPECIPFLLKKLKENNVPEKKGIINSINYYSPIELI